MDVPILEHLPGMRPRQGSGITPSPPRDARGDPNTMKPRRRFVPSEIVKLEDRVVLSHVGAAAVVARQAVPQRLRAGFHGNYLTTLPVDIGGDTTTNLVGSARLARIGRIGLGGDLSSNPSLPPEFSGTQGELRIVGSPQFPGTATLAVSGPATSLA